MGCAAIIVASGSSRRMGFDKLAADLCGKPVLVRTVEAFMAAADVTRVVVVCPAERFRLLEAHQFAKPLTRVDGGDQRQDSVANGLAALAADDLLVAVHDGARPLIHPQDIAGCVAASLRHDAAALARAVTDTLKKADPRGFSREAVDRTDLWAMETPQVFRTDLLRRAYAAVRDQGLAVTDEVSALEAIGVPVKLVPSSSPNPKITVPADLDLAAALTR